MHATEKTALIILTAAIAVTVFVLLNINVHVILLSLKGYINAMMFKYGLYEPVPKHHIKDVAENIFNFIKNRGF